MEHSLELRVQVKKDVQKKTGKSKSEIGEGKEN